MNAFQVAPLLLVVALAACRTAAESAVDAARDKAISCLKHEAQEIAPEPVDLDSAATATMSRCNEELSTERSAYLESWSGYEDDVVRTGLEKIRDARMQQARSFIAVERTRRDEADEKGPSARTESQSNVSRRRQS
jgi:curli biogenesis system outer membrane secretion channel CsgG